MSSAFGYAVWAVLGLATLGVWAWSHAPSGSQAAGHAPARPAVLLDRIATGPLLRIVLVLYWMWFGWHLFAR